jgi:hypothetical protein
MSESIFVSDGMTFRGEVPAAPGIYPAVSFTYRPATFDVRTEYGSAVGPERAKVAAEILSRQVKEVKVDGQAIRLTPGQASKLHVGLFAALFDAVMGYVGPAADTEKNSSPSSESQS